MLNLDNINLRDGNVTYNTFKIDLTKTPYGQTQYLDEDLIQIKYGFRYTVDVGWIHMGEPDGFFLIVVIEDRDWSVPLLELKVKKFEDFIESLQKAIDFTTKFIEENSNRPLRDSAID